MNRVLSDLIGSADFPRSTSGQHDEQPVAVMRGGRRLRGFALALAFVPLIYCLGFRFFRDLGEPALVFTIVCALASVAASGSLIISRTYVVFLTYATFILALSLGNVIPRSWTIYHDNVAALRHWIWIPMVPLLVTNFHWLVQALLPLIRRHPLLVLAAVYAITRLVGLAELHWNVGLWTWYSNTFTNEAAVLIAVLAYCLFYSDRLVTQVVLVALAALMFVSLQAQLFLALIVLIRFARSPGAVVWAALVIAAIGLLLGPLFVAEVNHLDANSGIRAVLWRDVWTAVHDTLGIGVGFGTEYITNDFQAIKDGAWRLADESDPGRLFIGTHSSFYDVLFRLGLPGAALFLVWFLGSLRMSAAAPLVDRRMGAALATLAILMNAFNNGLSSMNFLFGTCFCLAFILVLRRNGIAALELPQDTAPPARP